MRVRLISSSIRSMMWLEERGVDCGRNYQDLSYPAAGQARKILRRKKEAQTAAVTRVFLVLSQGRESTRKVEMASTRHIELGRVGGWVWEVQWHLSSPRVISMKKKRKLQRFGQGRVLT